jgi:hypothetical protein
MNQMTNDLKIVFILALTVIILLSMIVLKYIISTPINASSDSVNVELAIIETTKVQIYNSGVYELKPQIITMDEIDVQYISMNDK